MDETTTTPPRGPFWAPVGTVRAGITGLLILLVGIPPLFGLPANEALMGLAGMAVRDYFSHRETQENGKGEGK
jgi:hypothetical protein